MLRALLKKIWHLLDRLPRPLRLIAAVALSLGAGLARLMGRILLLPISRRPGSQSNLVVRFMYLNLRLQRKSDRLRGWPGEETKSPPPASEPFFSTGVSVKATEAEIIGLADAYIYAGRSQEGIRLLTGYVRTAQNPVAASLMLADLLLKAADPWEALAVLERAAADSPDQIEIEAALGEFGYRFLRAGQCLETYFGNFLPSGERNILDFFQGDFALEKMELLARRMLGKVVSYPTTPQSMPFIGRCSVRLAMMHLARGEYGEAHALCARVLETGYALPWAAMVCGLACEGLGDPAGALQAYKRAVAMDGRFISAQRGLARLYDAKHERRKAAEHLLAAMKGMPLALDAGAAR
jgi:tetratricopeptide (TPR) repeat protein